MIHMHGFSSDNVVREKPHLQSRGDTTKMKLLLLQLKSRPLFEIFLNLLSLAPTIAHVYSVEH
jgi:hypothetical protein